VTTKTSQQRRRRRRRAAGLPVHGPGRYTIEESHPIKAQAAIVAYAATGNKARAARESGLHVETVGFILQRNPEALNEARKTLATRALALADETLTIAGDKKRSLSAYQAVLSSKILGQMALEQLDQAPAPVRINVALFQTGKRRLAEIEQAIARLESLAADPSAPILPADQSPQDAANDPASDQLSANAVTLAADSVTHTP
jgi:hypothetical protein